MGRFPRLSRRQDADGIVIGIWLEGRLDLKQASGLISAMPAYIFGLGYRQGRAPAGRRQRFDTYDPIVETTVAID